ncbi:MAG TPA: hypothetical protein VH419_04970 [Nocardioidaceae bacterium]|jgi:nucleotide-binding universal stress UspA family protein
MSFGSELNTILVATDGYAVPHAPSERDRVLLDEAAAQAAERGVNATSALRLGSTVASALLGSVSLGVLHKATRPVLIVRGAHSTHSSTTPPRAATSA